MSLTLGPVTTPVLVQSGNSFVLHPTDDSNGGPYFNGTNQYIVGFKEAIPAGTPLTIAVYKSTDGGLTWTEMDVAHGPVVNTNGSFSVFYPGTGTVISFALHTGNSTLAAPIHIVQFDMATDTYTVINSAGPSAFPGELPSLLLVRRSNGHWIVFFQQFSLISNTSDTYIAQFDGAAWGATLAVSNGLASTDTGNVTGLIAVDGADNVLLIWYNTVSGTKYGAYWATFSSGNVLSGNTLFYTGGTNDPEWFATLYNSVTPSTWCSHGVVISGINKIVWALPFTPNNASTRQLRLLIADITVPLTPTFSFVTAINGGSSSFAFPTRFTVLGTNDYLVGMTSGPGLAPQVWISQSNSLTTWPAHTVLYDLSVNPPVPAPPVSDIDSLTFGVSGSTVAIAAGLFSFQGSQNNCEVQYYFNANSTLTLTCPPNTSFTVGVPYNQTLQANGGVAPFNFSILAGSLPTGLTLNPTTGVISGTPTQQGTFPVTIRVVDSA